MNDLNRWSRLIGQPWWRSWHLWLVVLIALALCGWGWFKWRGAAPSAQVITTQVERVDLEDTVLASGTIEAAKQVSVGAQVSGQIKKLHVRLGEAVIQGQLIAEIDATNQSNSLRSSQAQVALLMAQQGAKRAALHQAQLNFERQKRLLAQDAASRADYENADATLAASQADLTALSAQVAQAQIAVETARVNLGYTRIVAPMAGVVVAVIAEEGRTVNANQSAPTIIKLANLDTVQIKAQISEADVVRVKPGLPVYFTILGEPNSRYDAKLRAVEPAPESDQAETSNTSTSSSNAAIYYNALFDVPNSDHKLRISMTAQVFVVLAKVPGALVIPATALGERKGKKYVVRVQQGQGREQTIVNRDVSVGLNNRVQAQVLQGLKEGEAVVVGEAPADAKGSGGTSRMRPGMF